MLKKLPKRKRRIVITALSGAAFLAASTAAILYAGRPDAPYRPGESADGITDALARDLPTHYVPVMFTDVSAEAGITFHHFSGTRSSQLPEDMGSGAAWGDYDGDGWLDLYVTNLAGPLTMSSVELAETDATSRLYRNNGNGSFSDVSDLAGVAYRGWANGAAWADIDNDGDADLVLATYGSLVLYRNNGDGTFTDQSHRSGLGDFEGFWSGASWADYDRDGLLDLYVTGYVQYREMSRDIPSHQYDIENPASINPSSFEPERNLLFHNRGDGTFEEIGLEAGVSNPEGRSLAAAWVDVDEDGWVDLYVANDVSDNVLYRNLGVGAFEDVSHQARVADYRGAMGIAAGDWDGDTDMDLAVTHWIAQENALYTNQRVEDRARGVDPVLRFVDDADRRGVGQIALDYVGWATSFLDFDNDGRLDLFVVNGSTLQERDNAARLVPMNAQLFWNAGPDSGYFDVSPVSGAYFSERHVGRGGAFADYDRDGDVDLFVVNHGGRAALLRNDVRTDANWLAVRLEGRSSNRSAVGTRLRLVAGSSVQIRQVGAQASYASQSTLVEHFGLGSMPRVDSLVIDWPSGLRQVLTDLPARQELHIVEEGPAS